MTKNTKYILLFIFIFIAIITGLSVYYFLNDTEKPNEDNNITVNNNQNSGNTLDLPTEGNSTVITTNVDTTLRVINEYDKSFFTANKNLLIMFGSWCSNCQEEISEIQKILNYYKKNKNVNVVLIAHEYEDTITDLIDLIENNVDFGDVEVKIDLGRVIRKKIDPEASTIPISYVVDKDGNVLEVYNDSLTLEKAIEMIEK